MDAEFVTPFRFIASLCPMIVVAGGVFFVAEAVIEYRRWLKLYRRLKAKGLIFDATDNLRTSRTNAPREDTSDNPNS